MPEKRLTLVDLEMRGDFVRRHIGPGEEHIAAMLETLGVESLDDLVDKAVPASIVDDGPAVAGQRLSPGGPAPKEQPPRKLSGKRTAGKRHLWKAAAVGPRGRARGIVPRDRVVAHRRGKPAAARGRPGESLRFHDRGGRHAFACARPESRGEP